MKIAVSGETMTRCGEAFAFPRLDRLRVKGKQQPVEVFSVLRWEDWNANRDELKAGQAAYTEYSQGNFSIAAKLFAEHAAGRPSRIIYRVYTERCRGLAASPPSEWDGVWSNVRK